MLLFRSAAYSKLERCPSTLTHNVAVDNATAAGGAIATLRYSNAMKEESTHQAPADLACFVHA